jgi:hypothetical protein
MSEDPHQPSIRAKTLEVEAAAEELDQGTGEVSTVKLMLIQDCMKI